MESECLKFCRAGYLSLGRINERRIPLFIVSMFACLSIIGCSCGEGTTSIPYFPVQNEPEAIQMQVRIEGRLILDEGYLRLKPILHESYIIIWPYGYTVRLEDSTVQVIDADGQVVACVGIG